MATGGSLRKFIARRFGNPKSTTDETWFATSGSIGFGTVAGSTPSGTAAEVIPVVKVDSRPIGTGKPGPLTRDLIERFHKLARGEG